MNLALPPGSRKPLREHQVQAVRAGCAELAVASRAQVIMACGTGKTYVGAEVAAELDARTILVVVPTLELLAQTAAAHAGQGTAGRLVAICSDIDALAHADEVAEMARAVTGLAGKVSTSPAALAAWLSEPGRVTMFVTYASLPVVVAAHRDHFAQEWDLAVIDEAHRAAGRTDRTWNVINDDAAIPARHRLYMTATPRVMNSKRFETTSMDDPGVFGRQAYRLSFAEAIDKKLIAPYRMVVSVVTDDEVYALTGAEDSVLEVDSHPVPAPMLAAQIALLRACHEFNLHRVISYHHRVISASGSPLASRERATC
ncbi:DEAD/DEAH box helicase family protein [Amycolatopsis sp. RTGN1]|uniref:DEAD/DEAH box helicase family protein n=1 Tax=Amycolatopsis ponsaeliensis TaxID=2992142 RepID=UPI002549D976|nr:DEAD/DEAH box helicase family protein [Amycolatopsis sp. RTGN1]